MASPAGLTFRMTAEGCHFGPPQALEASLELGLSHDDLRASFLDHGGAQRLVTITVF